MACFCVMLPAISWAQQENLAKTANLPPQTLQKIISLSFGESLELVIAQENIKSQREAKRQAFYALFPQLALTANQRDYDRESNNRTLNAQESSTTSLALSQTLAGGGAPSYGYVAASKDYKIALQNMQQTEIDILLRIIAGYNNLYIAQETEKTAVSSLQRLEQHYNATQQRANLGSASQTELQQAAARLENGKAVLIQAQSNLVTARASFSIITGKSVDFSALETHITPEQHSLIPANIEEALQLTHTHSTAINIARLQKEKAQALRKRAPLAFIPNISLSVGQTKTTNPSNPNGQTDNHIDLNLSYNITPGKAVSASRQAAANLKTTLHQEGLTKRSVNNSAIAAWQNFFSTQATLSARKAARTARKSAFLGTQTEYQLGQRSQLELLDAQDELLDAEQNHIQATGNMVTAYYQLMSHIGQLQFSQFATSN